MIIDNFDRVDSMYSVYVYTYPAGINRYFYQVSYLILIRYSIVNISIGLASLASDIEAAGIIDVSLHPYPMSDSLPFPSLPCVIRTNIGRKEDALSRVSVLRSPRSSARFQSWRTRAEESTGWALISPVAADVFSIFYLAGWVAKGTEEGGEGERVTLSAETASGE